MTAGRRCCWPAQRSAPCVGRRGSRTAGLPISHDPQEFLRNWEQLQNYCITAGRDPEKLLRILYVTLNVNRDESQAKKETEAFLQTYYGAGHEQASRTQGIECGEPERCADFLRRIRPRRSEPLYCPICRERSATANGPANGGRDPLLT